jgi:hypothetical protein
LKAAKDAEIKALIDHSEKKRVVLENKIGYLRMLIPRSTKRKWHVRMKMSDWPPN